MFKCDAWDKPIVKYATYISHNALSRGSRQGILSYQGGRSDMEKCDVHITDFKTQTLTQMVHCQVETCVGKCAANRPLPLAVPATLLSVRQQRPPPADPPRHSKLLYILVTMYIYTVYIVYIVCVYYIHIAHTFACMNIYKYVNMLYIYIYVVGHPEYCHASQELNNPIQ